MPPNPDLVTGSPSEASILLVEEYDALAIAIGSALRKFAPHHARRVAASLPEAQAIAEADTPELVVIDLDPPQTGLVAFLEQLKTSQPTLRVLAIGCGISTKFAAARAGDGAVQFLEKPFELADFGKAIETALGGAEISDRPRGGILADLDLPDLIALECVNGAASILKLDATGGRSGEIHFAAGQLCHASAPGLIGEAAVEEMLRWRLPHFSESERPADAPRTINAPWDAVVIDALRKTGTRTERSEISRTRTREREAVARTGKKIVVIDDTELLLIFVEEILGTADPQLRISAAHTGTEGCRRAELSAPDLILLDYSLPDINGDEVCRRLLEDERTALIPIIMMSGHVAEMNATAKRFANVVATISKPFLSHELVTLVEKTLSEGPRAVLEIAKMKEPPTPERPASKQKHHHGNGKGKAAPPTGESASSSSPTAQAGPSIAATIALAETESIGAPIASSSVLTEELITTARISPAHLSPPIARGPSSARSDAAVAVPEPVVHPLVVDDIRETVAHPESRILPFVPISEPGGKEVAAPSELETAAPEIQEPRSPIEEASPPANPGRPTPLLTPLSFEPPLPTTSLQAVVVEPSPPEPAIEIVEH
ncbi:MAG: response regulator, partial [Verrucomicrobiota bacterium]|nr:response regulator [Verrucomicrobiota bacterium]